MQIHFILVSPHIPENVGAACRALKTMGFASLRVVAPRCDLRGEKVHQLAHGSHDILHTAGIFQDLAAAIADCELVIASTAKERDLRQDYYDVKELPALISSKSDGVENCAIVFGREDGGLSTAELALCPLVSSIPMATVYPSLNLAQAVMLYAYSLSPINAHLSTIAAQDPMPFGPLRAKLETALDTLEFLPTLALRGRIIERAAALSSGDMKLLHSVLARLLSYIEKNGGDPSYPISSPKP